MLHESTPHIPEIDFHSAMVYGLAEWLAIEAQAKSAGVATGNAKTKQVLVVYEEGGISHMDSFEPKPETPADRVRGCGLPARRGDWRDRQAGRRRDRIAPYAARLRRDDLPKLGLTADARLTRPDVAVNLPDGGKPISELF